MVLSASRLKVSVVLSKVNQLWKLASVVVIEYSMLQRARSV